MEVASTSSLAEQVLREEAEKYKSIEVYKKVDPRIDVGNLLIEDLEGLEDSLGKSVTNDKLKNLARDNCQLLVNEIWKLPTERVEEVIVAKLPRPSTRLPREKPIPKERPETKWQRFANLKGIQNRKKSRKVWDESAQTWAPRWGYKRTNDDTKDWLIEVPDQQDPYKDYYGARKEAKKERTAKNEMQRMKNLNRNANFTPLGVGMTTQQKTPQQLAQQISRAKEATASVGRFTKSLSQEKAPKNKGKKRLYGPNEGNVKGEQSKQLEIAKRLQSKRPKIDSERAAAHLNAQQEQRNAERNRDAPKSKKATRKPSNTRKSGQHKGKGTKKHPKKGGKR